MPSPLIPLHNTHIIGQHSREWVLGYERFSELTANHFVWVGHSVVRPPYRIVRQQSPYAHIVTCYEGKGRVVINDEVVDWTPGKVLLCPRGAAHAFEAVSDEPWNLAWVFYDDTIGHPLVQGSESRLVDANVSGFVSTLKLLTNEAASTADPAAIQALVTLLKIHTLRIGDGKTVDERLARLWETVDAEPARNWNLESLAQCAHMSPEHLRRLCRRDYACTPMKRVFELRMHRACVKLRESQSKLEVIAAQLGFSTVYYFSNAFKRWSGYSPGEFRKLKC